MAGANDGIAKFAFCVGSGKECFSDETELGGIVDVVAGLVRLESGGEFVGVFEDLLGGAGHGGHLRYLGRAGTAWMMTSVSGMPCFRTLGTMGGASTSTSWLAPPSITS